MGQRSARKHAEEQAQPALGPPQKNTPHQEEYFFVVLSRDRIPVEAVLRKGYGDKYDHSRFIGTRREIGYELDEDNLDDAALSIRRRLKAYDAIIDSISRWMIVATSALVAVPCGAKLPPSRPVMMPVVWQYRAAFFA